MTKRRYGSEAWFRERLEAIQTMDPGLLSDRLLESLADSGPRMASNYRSLAGLEREERQWTASAGQRRNLSRRANVYDREATIIEAETARYRAELERRA